MLSKETRIVFSRKCQGVLAQVYVPHRHPCAKPSRQIAPDSQRPSCDTPRGKRWARPHGPVLTTGSIQDASIEVQALPRHQLRIVARLTIDGCLPAQPSGQGVVLQQAQRLLG